MDYPKIHEWELAQDAVDRSPLGDLPEDPFAGQIHEGVGSDGVMRHWIAVAVLHGNPAGRWAYWAPWTTAEKQSGIGPHPSNLAIADKIFNGDVHNFIGMLAVPYVPRRDTASVMWVLVDPKPSGPKIEYVVEPPLPARHERYERSREVYDVETDTTTPVERYGQSSKKEGSA
jgi:hypothetical protein